MNHPDDFAYGPVARATYMALLWLTVFISFTNPVWLLYYIPLLLFLGVFLKPLLVKSGLARWYSQQQHRMGERRYRTLTEQRRREVDAAKIRLQHKQRRHKHHDLPRNW